MVQKKKKKKKNTHTKKMALLELLGKSVQLAKKPNHAQSKPQHANAT